jgi:hypothetical protein
MNDNDLGVPRPKAPGRAFPSKSSVVPPSGLSGTIPNAKYKKTMAKKVYLINSDGSGFTHGVLDDKAKADEFMERVGKDQGYEIREMILDELYNEFIKGDEIMYGVSYSDYGRSYHAMPNPADDPKYLELSIGDIAAGKAYHIRTWAKSELHACEILRERVLSKTGIDLGQPVPHPDPSCTHSYVIEGEQGTDI